LLQPELFTASSQPGALSHREEQAKIQRQQVKSKEHVRVVGGEEFASCRLKAACKPKAEDRMGLWISRYTSRNTFPTLHPALHTSSKLGSLNSHAQEHNPL